MDSYDFSDLAVGSQQPLFGSYPQPSTIKRHQTYPQSFPTPVYNSIEDWSAAELTTDSAPSPGSGSPISPIFNGFSFSNPGAGDDWANWGKIEQSPDSDFFLKSELLDSPDLTSIPLMGPVLNSVDMTNPGLDDVVFGREGINDTRPLFQSPPQLNPSIPSQAQSLAGSRTLESSSPSANMAGLPTPPDPSASQQQRRYPARNSLKRKSSDAQSSTPSSPRSSCSPPPPQRRHTSSSFAKEDAAAAGSKPTMGPKKTAHNMIEKRYRTNLNDKIAALRDSVPALRVMVHRLEHADDAGPCHASYSSSTGNNNNNNNNSNNNIDVMDEIKAEAGIVDGDDDDLRGLTPAHKLNKATILSKATEYIAHLERKNRSLTKENSALRNRVEGFEMLVMSRTGQQSVWN